jgi:hypothetical protein
MIDESTLTINRDLDDVKAQVKRELETIKDLMNLYSYRNSPPGWTMPFQLHRLRRTLRIHYLAMRIRDASPVPAGMRELSWTLDPNIELS